jgi:hypothetical protein
MNVLVIVNNQPHGPERQFNTLRLANALSKREQVKLRVFRVFRVWEEAREPPECGGTRRAPSASDRSDRPRREPLERAPGELGLELIPCPHARATRAASASAR